MQPTAKKAGLASAAILIVVTATLSLVLCSRRPQLNFAPVPKNAPTLNQADVEKVLGVEQLHSIWHVSSVPVYVKESFTNLTDHPFDLVDPGRPISTDYIVPGESSRRLVFAADSNDSAIVVYEQGGYADSFVVVVFWFEEGGRDWAATLDAPVSDLTTLKRAIQKNQIRPWKGME